MRWTRRGGRAVRRTAAAVAGIEPLESRTHFSVAAVPLAPGSSAGPVAALTTLTPTFTWSAVAGVNGYQLRVLDRTDGVYALTVNVGPGTTQYTAKAGTLLPGRSFAWTVRDVIGVTPAAAHGTLYFGTPVPPAPVAAPAVVGGPSRPVLSTLAPTLRWSAAANVNGYVLHVYDVTTRATVTVTAAATATSHTFAAGALQPGHQFNWNVRDVIGTTTGRAVSNTEHFQMPALPAPVTLSPGEAAAPGPVLPTFTPTFLWNPVTSVGGFSGYLLTLYDRSTGHATPVAVAATSYTLPTGQLVAGHRYVWNLRLLDGSVTGRAVSVPFRYFVAPAVG